MPGDLWIHETALFSLSRDSEHLSCMSWFGLFAVMSTLNHDVKWMFIIMLWGPYPAGLSAAGAPLSLNPAP